MTDAMRMELDPNREFWVGMRSVYLQQIRLIRARFGPGLDSDDGLLAAGVMTSLMNAVTAIERRWGLGHGRAKPR